MWKYNIFGIRQAFGNFVKWLADVFDSWIKPILWAIGSYIIILYETIKFAITHAGLIWERVWLTMLLAGHRIWNAILLGVQWWVNSVSKPIQMLWDAIVGIASFLGYKLPRLKFEINLARFQTDTSDIIDRIVEIDTQLSQDFTQSMAAAGESIQWWTDTLNNVKPSLTALGDEFVKQGDRIDAGLEEGTGFLEDFGSALGNVASNIMPNFVSSTSEVTETNNLLSDSFMITRENIIKARSEVDPYIRELSRIPRSVETHVNIYKHVYWTTGWGAGMGMSMAMPWEFYQRGGIVTRPTTAILGERGPEAVIPLDKLGAGQTINISPTIYITIEGITPDEIVDKVKSEMSAKIVEELNSMFRR